MCKAIALYYEKGTHPGNMVLRDDCGKKMQIFLLSLELLDCDIDGRIRRFFPPSVLSGVSPTTRHAVKGFCVNIREDVK